MKKQTAITQTDPAKLARLNDTMSQTGKTANEAAALYTFADPTERKADNTIRRKRARL